MASIFEYKDNLHVMDHIPAVLKWGKIDEAKPDVSILMPVYNHPQFFKIALETALKQDYEGTYEIVVLDNNMEDDVTNINEFEKYIKEKNDTKILYYKNEHNIQGINSYNRLPQLARADYFTFLHDDDELCPNCLSCLIKFKKENNLTKELIIPSQQVIDGESRVISKPRRFNGKNIWGKDYKITMFDLLLVSYTNGGGCLHNKKAFLDLGGYNSDFIPSADRALYILYIWKYGGYFVNKDLFRYRFADNDTSKVYERIVEQGFSMETDLMSQINLPNFFLKRVISAKRNLRLKKYSIQFRANVRKTYRKTDNLIVKTAVFLNFLLHI